MPNFTPSDQAFEIGKALLIQEGFDVSIFATGHLVWKAIEAVNELAGKGFSAEIINIHTIKPLDEDAILRSVGKTRCAVSAEEHQCNGGLGDSIAQILARKSPTPLEMVAVYDSFGESGKPEELMKKYHLDTPDVVQAALRVMTRK
jgi:transketolase